MGYGDVGVELVAMLGWYSQDRYERRFKVPHKGRYIRNGKTISEYNKKYYRTHKKEIVELEIIEKRKALEAARIEYHSLMRVRELKDINSSYDLTATMLRLEANLVGAKNSLNKVLKGR